MTKLTAGDCVAVLGRQWAESQGIRTSEDMAKPATSEQQKLAEWAVNATKPKTERPGPQVVKRQKTVVDRKGKA